MAAKKTPLAKIQESAKNLEASKAEVLDWKEIASASKEPRIKAKAESAMLRYAQDVKYLELKIRGIIAREAPLDKLIANASSLIS